MHIETKIRIARPTDNLSQITTMYIDGLGFSLLSSFHDHEGFSGSIIGHSHHLYHLEFTSHSGQKVGRAPTQDNLLIFYIPDKTTWQLRCEAMTAAGFTPVTSYNPYWENCGKTFEDIDGYRVVLQNDSWTR